MPALATKWSWPSSTTDDEARNHPRRNIITRALGIEPDVKVDWWTLPIIRGDRFVLCSDGLVDEVSDADITQILLDNPDPQAAADQLIASANEAGGRDNVTVVVVDVLDGDDPPDPTQEIDLAPSWADDTGGLDAPMVGEPAALAATGVLSDEALTIQADDIETDEPGRKRTKPRLIRALVVFLILAALVASAVAIGAWARRGYYVDFDDDGDVTVYQGREGGLLWIEPTIESGGPNRDDLSDDSIDDVERRPSFDERSEAQAFVAGLDLAEDTEEEVEDDDAADTESDATIDDTGPDDETVETTPPTTEA